MAQEVSEKDKGGFVLGKCKFVEKRRGISEKVMGKLPRAAVAPVAVPLILSLGILTKST